MEKRKPKASAVLERLLEGETIKMDRFGRCFAKGRLAIKAQVWSHSVNQPQPDSETFLWPEVTVYGFIAMANALPDEAVYGSGV